jgi:ubiquinone/menaquinone biosynthesis C-methylase UbiE
MTRWQQFYQEDPRVLAAGHSHCAGYAAKCFQSKDNRKILDLGCGVGRDSVFLAASGFHVVSLDMARSGLDHARKRSAPQPLPLVQADARCLPCADASFDGVYCFGLLHEFTDPSADEDVDRVMSEILRVLCPNGMLVLAVLAGEPDQGMPHVRLFNEVIFDKATNGFTCMDKQVMSDIGCTGNSDYRIWRGAYVKQ